MSLLTVVQNVCNENGYAAAPSSVVVNTDNVFIQMLALAKKAGKRIRDAHAWKEMQREYTFTLVSGQAAYANPADLHYRQFETAWDRSLFWRILGPYTAQDWQLLKSGLVAVAPYFLFREFGVTDNTFTLFQTPTASHTGQTCVFEYLSLNCWRPRTYAAGLTWAPLSYCFYNGTYYKTTGGGTSVESTPALDVTLGWTAYTGIYDEPLADTDVFILGEETLEFGLKALFKREHRFEGWADDMADFQKRIDDEFAKGMSGKTLSLERRVNVRPWPNVPQTGIKNYNA